jgi:RimJ/RimL family protein N-acetyltransferase
MDSADKGISTIPSLVGDKVYLRPAVPDDIIESHHWLTQSDPDSVFPYISRLVSPTEAAEIFRRETKNEIDLKLMIIKKADDEPIGTISTFNFNPLNRSTELTVLIDPEKRRKGHGKDAVKTLSKYLFFQRGLNRIYAHLGAFNNPAEKLFKSVGYKQDGKLRQHHFYKGEFHDTLIYSLLRFELDW